MRARVWEWEWGLEWLEGGALGKATQQHISGRLPKSNPFLRKRIAGSLMIQGGTDDSPNKTATISYGCRGGYPGTWDFRKSSWRHLENRLPLHLPPLSE